MVTSELRLHAIWTGAVTVPVGLMMYVFFPFTVTRHKEKCHLHIFSHMLGVSPHLFCSFHKFSNVFDGLSIHFGVNFVAPCVGMGKTI